MAENDVMSLTAHLSLDTSAYEAALHAAVTAGQNFASNLGSVSAGLNSAQTAANSNGAAMNAAAQGAANLNAQAAQAATSADQLGDEMHQTAQQTAELAQEGAESGNSVQNLGAQMQKAAILGNLMASAIRSAAHAIVDFGKQSIGAGMDFDSSMSQVAATMGVTVDEVQNLRDFAQEMGASTAFSATQAADALNYMALAGYDAEKSMSMLPNVLNLAASGSMDLAHASDMITDTQSALGLSMDETTELVNKMAKTASSSNTSVSQLGEAMLQIGGSAKKLSGGTTELATILGILADNGMKGAEGGTHLRNMLTSLMSPTKDAKAMMEQLNVSLYDSQGNMRTLNDVFMDLREGMNSLATQAERDQVITTIFNARDMKAAEAMIAGVGDRYAELSGKIDEAAGAAQAMAGTQLDNLKGDITLFKSAVEGAQIAISDRLTPSLRNFTQFGSKAVSEMSKGFGRDGLSGAMEALHQTIDKEIGGGTAQAIYAVEGATKAAIAAFLTYQAVVKGMTVVQSIMATVKAIQAATTAQEAFNAVTAMNPYAAIAAGVVAAGIAIKSYIDIQTDAIDVTVDGTEAMTDAQKELLDSIAETTKAVADGAQTRKDRMQQTDAEIEANRKLYDQLWRLNEMEDLSTAQKAKMAAIVETLNSSVAGLNLVFDEQTGKLKNNKEAVDELMNSYLREAKMEAARENLVELMKQQITAEKSYNSVSSERNKLIYRRNELLRMQERLQKVINDHENYGYEEISNAKDGLRTIGIEMAAIDDQLGVVNAAYVAASQGLHGVNDEISEMSDILGGKADEIVASSEKITASAADVSRSILANKEFVKTAGSVFFDTTEQVSKAALTIQGKTAQISADTATSIGELIDTYDQLVEKQRSAIESSVDFFGGFDKETSVTFEDLWNNLSSTNDGLTDWANGIEALENRGISEGLLQELKDMGLKSYNYVYDLCWATDQQLQKYSRLWDETNVAVNTVTDQMVSGQKETIENQLRQLAGVPAGHIEDFKQAYWDMGIAADEGFAKGIKAKLDEASETGAEMANEAIDSTMTALDAHSPSRRFEEIGRYVGEGFALGMNDEGVMSDIAAAARNMANEAIASVRETLDEHSPSKVLRKMGGFFSEGFALGIDDKASMAEDSARTMADMAAESAYIEPDSRYTAGNTVSPLTAEQMATINLTVDGKLMASVLAPLLDVINGRNIALATRGRQS